jgi:hypothetical protein
VGSSKSEIAMLRQETFDNNGRWFAEPECGIAAAWLGLYVMILGTVLVSNLEAVAQAIEFAALH